MAGWARSAVNYSVRVEHSSSTPLDYFVLLQHPKFLLGVQAAYTLQPNGFGGDYLYKSPDAARARAAVDVLVDGRPVWSSEPRSRVGHQPAMSPGRARAGGTP